MENEYPLEWEIKSFDRLSLDALYELLKLRVDVFVVEQNCPYPEIDNKDRLPDALHLCGRNKDRALTAYLRILPPGASYPEASFGRVAVAEKSRGQGICHAMVKKALDEIHCIWPGTAVRIGAQAYLAGFYESHGFKAVSETYLEDGILHVDMLKTDVS
jgi:ElaA protein